MVAPSCADASAPRGVVWRAQPGDELPDVVLFEGTPGYGKANEARPRGAAPGVCFRSQPHARTAAAAPARLVQGQEGHPIRRARRIHARLQQGAAPPSVATGPAPRRKRSQPCRACVRLSATRGADAPAQLHRRRGDAAQEGRGARRLHGHQRPVRTLVSQRKLISPRGCALTRHYRCSYVMEAWGAQQNAAGKVMMARRRDRAPLHVIASSQR